MEGMTAYRQQMEALRCRAKAQVEALGVLEKAFAQEAEHLHRGDQAQCLDALRARVTYEVSHIRRMESAASFGFTKATLITGLAKLALGSLMASAVRSQEDPLSFGVWLANTSFARTAPFGNVAVAVGPGGLPDEVNVIPLSRHAREMGKSESEIMAAIEAHGYRLLTPESFFRALDQLREHVLKGAATLPVAIASFALGPANGDRQ